MKKDNTLIYLASPYSHREEDVRDLRFRAVSSITSDMMRLGLQVYSPIAHNHPIAVQYNLPKEVDFWWNHNRIILERCDVLAVFALESWENSKGVAKEIALAKEIGLPIIPIHRLCHKEFVKLFS